MLTESKKQEQDIFDKWMMSPMLKTYYPFYHKHKEVLLYLFFGGITFFLSIGLFAGIDYATNINELINNIICWVICVIFQFTTNRTWVFGSHVNGIGEFIKQTASFFGGRVFTLLLEEGIIAIFITWMGMNAIAVKLAAQFVVIVLNYIISKLIVFGNRQ